MHSFDDVGAEVERVWERAGFDEVALPRIAAEVLREARLGERLRGHDVLRHLLRAGRLPPQQDLGASFGQPPITVFRGRRFHVQVLFWLHGSTTIHRHGFSGAFQVLEGSSLHSRWRFVPEQRVNSHFFLGRTELLGCEVLARGAVVPILPELTHGLFHLEAPSATIVVRSDGELEPGPQYEYHPPTIAVDPFFVDPLVERWLQALHLLRSAKHAEHDELAEELLGRADLHTAFRVLEGSQREEPDFGRLERLAGAARRRHGAVVDALLAAVREGVRRRAIHRLRREVQDPERRFFLALLQNLPDRAAIYGMVRERVPERAPRETVLRWLESLSGTSRLGVELDGPLERVLVEALLDGLDQGATLRKLHERFEASSVEEARPALEEHVARLRRTLLAPLFEGSAA